MLQKVIYKVLKQWLHEFIIVTQQLILQYSNSTSDLHSWHFLQSLKKTFVCLTSYLNVCHSLITDVHLQRKELMKAAGLNTVNDESL